jgi:cytochrome c biogenesis factor
MKKLADLLFSTRLTGVLFIVFAAAMAIATFIENDYGTQASKALVYNAWWFELIMVFFVINFSGNIFRYRLYRKEKWPVLLFHLAFILILIGAGITRYVSFEAIMPIKEGAVTNTMLSEKTYFNVVVDNNKEQKVIEKVYLFSPDVHNDSGFVANAAKFLNFIRGTNDFFINTDFRGKSVTVNYVNYIPNAFEEFQADENYCQNRL